MRVLFTTGVWGEPYVRKFLEVSLPTQLAEGNITGAKWSEGSRYLVVTSPSGAEQFRRSPAAHQLARTIDLEIAVLPGLDQPASRLGKYHLMSQCQLEAIRRSRNFDAIMFGYADMLWAAGTFETCARRLGEGYLGVMAPALPVCEAEFVNALRRSSSLWKDRGEIASLDLPPRVMVRMILEQLHPMATANFWDQRVASITPAYSMWQVPGQGLALRAFHLHPVMIRVQSENGSFFREFATSLDEEYVAHLFPSKDSLYFANDSDEMVLCSLMQPFSHGFQVDPPVPPSARLLALWAERHACVVHREFFGEECRLHYTDIDSELWEGTKRDGAQLYRRVRERLMLPDSILAVEDAEAWDARTSHVRRIAYRTSARYITGFALDSVPTAALFKVIVWLTTLSVLRRVHRAALWFGLDLRVFAGRAYTLAKAMARKAGLRRNVKLASAISLLGLERTSTSLKESIQLCSTYPMRKLAKVCIRRILRLDRVDDPRS